MGNSGVAAVRLRNDTYLVALGKSSGKQYGFYTASKTSGPYMFQNASAIPNYKWGENANIVTECDTGDLYFFQMEANSNSQDYVHLYKLVNRNNNIEFEYVTERKFICRGSSVDGASDWCNFDAGVGSYVNPDGEIYLYATDWQQSSYGNVRLVEYR